MKIINISLTITEIMLIIRRHQCTYCGGDVESTFSTTGILAACFLFPIGNHLFACWFGWQQKHFLGHNYYRRQKSNLPNIDFAFEGITYYVLWEFSSYPGELFLGGSYFILNRLCHAHERALFRGLVFLKCQEIFVFFYVLFCRSNTLLLFEAGDLWRLVEKIYKTTIYFIHPI